MRESLLPRTLRAGLLAQQALHVSADEARREIAGYRSQVLDVRVVQPAEVLGAASATAAPR
jgi:hypothetical protein